MELTVVNSQFPVSNMRNSNSKLQKSRWTYRKLNHRFLTFPKDIVPEVINWAENKWRESRIWLCFLGICMGNELRNEWHLPALTSPVLLSLFFVSQPPYLSDNISISFATQKVGWEMRDVGIDSSVFSEHVTMEIPSIEGQGCSRTCNNWKCMKL